MSNSNNRRSFLKLIGGATALAPFVSTGGLTSEWPKYTGKKLGIALVGLGNYATNQIGRALEESDYWTVSGIVTGSPSKIPAWKEKWGIKDENVYDYEHFDDIAQNDEIDAVYILLPNSMHAEYTIRAAKAGKHVICEKPLANTVEEAEEMIKVCNENNVKLAVGYRLHFEPFNTQAQKWGTEETFGKLDYVDSSFAFKIGDPTQWRLKKEYAGGGPLMDLGIYCIQAMRYVTGEEPSKVTAQFGPVTDTERFSEVEESISWQFTFPSGTYSTGYTSYKTRAERIYASGAKGFFEISPAFSYGGLKGRSSQGDLDLVNIHHQRSQMEAMGSMFLVDGEVPDHCSGVEGLKDMKLLMAIYEAAETGKAVML